MWIIKRNDYLWFLEKVILKCIQVPLHSQKKKNKKEKIGKQILEAEPCP